LRISLVRQHLADARDRKRRSAFLPASFSSPSPSCERHRACKSAVSQGLLSNGRFRFVGCEAQVQADIGGLSSSPGHRGGHHAGRLRIGRADASDTGNYQLYVLAIRRPAAMAARSRWEQPEESEKLP
jgi:hypothetical protein